LHRRLCHLGYENVRKTLSMTKGVKLDYNKLPPERPCYTCEIAKSVRKVSRKPQPRATHAFDVIHTDVVGPIKPIGKNGHRWAVFYTDDATRARWVRTFKYKREAYYSTIAFVLFVKVQYSVDIKMFRLDGGSEYRGQKLLNFLQGRGIRLELLVPYTPEQNRVSKRSNCTIFEKLWSILYNTKALKNLWLEII
jgi:hypothetical protein